MNVDVPAAVRSAAATASPAPTAAPESPPCLIVNPRSFRAGRGLAARAIEIARAHGAESVSIDGPAELHAAVDRVLARRQRRVLVLAGDGTVGAVVDQLAKLVPGSWQPELLLLAGGRSNLTANDLLSRRGALAQLEHGLALSRDRRWDAAVTERPLLRIEQAPAPARFGFFVGAALVDSVIRRIHAGRVDRSGPLGAGHLSTPFGLLGLGLQAAVGRSTLACPILGVDAGAAGRLERQPVRLLLATTLQHRTGLFDPYPSRGVGDLRFAAVAGRAPRFWRSLPRLLTGRYTAAMDPASGYLGGRCDRLEVTGLAGYALDGETVDTDPTRPVVVTPGPRLRLVSF